MINTSTEYKQGMEQKRRFVAKATCLLKNGTVLDFDKTNLMSGGVKIADGVSSTSKFEIGSAIINQLTIMVFNEAEAFSDYDFSDAVLTVWVGMPLDDRIEWLKKGVFNASDPTTTPGVITLKALDNMSKFDTTYDGGIGFPASLQSIVQYCCTQCGVLLLNGEFPNFRYQINKNPFGDTSNITYRAIIAYCALLAGCYARCNADGRLEFKWYDTSAFDGIIDGGIFDETTEASYQTGADLDGGNFTDYSSGDSADGGTFTDNMPYHHIYSFSSLSVSTEEVVITGIRVTAADSEDANSKKIEGETYLCGAEGYVLDVSGNPLVEAGKAKEVAEYLAGRVVGMRFRPFQASAIGDPSWEAGDAAVVTDRKGNSYHTYLTNITYSTGGYASISCDAEPAARHSADRYAEINKVIADIKKDSQQKLTEYGKLLEQMNSLAINAMGYYETSVKQDDGSEISYMHDKPVLSESKIVYKKSVDGVFWTNDYQGTDAATTAAGKWKSGIDKDGNAVLNVIAAIGISFDWAHGGTLTLGGKDNGNGKLTILNAAGSQVGYIDNTGVHFDKGEFRGELKSGDDSTYVIVSDGNLSFYSSGKLVSQYGKGNNTSNVLYEKVYGGKTCAIQSGATWTTSNSDNSYSSARYDNGLRVGGGGKMRKLASNSEKDVNADILCISTPPGHASNEVSGILFDDSTSAPRIYSSMSGRMELAPGSSYNSGTVFCTGNFGCAGTKSRVADTEHFGGRMLYSYETPSPYFGDIGTAKTNETGICYVSIDAVFSEAINANVEYSVFLQKEGPGDIWVESKDFAFFIVKGTPNLAFSWEIKAIQKNYEYLRLEDYEQRGAIDVSDGIEELMSIFEGNLKSYDKEMEELAYENLTIISGDQ